MLVLSRKLDEAIEIGRGITITVTRIQGDRVSLGIVAPREVPVDRREIAESKRREQERRRVA